MFVRLTLLMAAACTLSAQPPNFLDAVRPVLQQNCSGCHNAKLASGNLNLEPFLAPASLSTAREGWEKIAAR